MKIRNSLRFFQMLMGCLSLSLLFGASDALAMRCAGKIISEGDSKFEVLAKCGKPDFIEDVRDEVFLGERSLVEGDIKLSKAVTVRVYQWIYNFGSNRLMQVLTFKNQELVKIESAGYGF